MPSNRLRDAEDPDLVRKDKIRIWAASDKERNQMWIIVSQKAKPGDVVEWGDQKWKLFKHEGFPGDLTFRKYKPR